MITWNDWEIPDVHLSKHPFLDEYSLHFLLNGYSYYILLQPNKHGSYFPAKVFHYLNSKDKCELCSRRDLEKCISLTESIGDLYNTVKRHRNVRLRLLFKG